MFSKYYFYFMFLFGALAQASLPDDSAVITTSIPSQETSSKSTSSGSGDFTLVQRAKSLNSKEVEIDFGGRSSNGGELKARVGMGKGFDLFALGTDRTNSLKPGGGIQWQFFGDNHRPFSMALLSQFRKGGFAEPNGEGEVDVEWLGTLKFGRSEISANLLEGSDLDGETRVFEGRLATAYKISSYFTGGLECEARWSSRRSSTDAGAESDDPNVPPQEIGNITTLFIGPMGQFRMDSLTLTANAGYGSYNQYFPGPVESSSGIAGAFKASYDF